MVPFIKNFRISKFVETESRFMVSRSCGEERRENDCLMNIGLHFGVTKCPGWKLHNIVNVQRAWLRAFMMWEGAVQATWGDKASGVSPSCEP